MSFPNFFSYMPASVRYDDTLTPNAKLLYTEITALCNKEGFCWADNSYFAVLYKVSNETISRWISQLRDRGYIEVEILQNKGNKRKITLDKIVNTHMTKKSRPSYQKNQDLLTKKSRPLDKNVNPIYENNTINNTINREETAIAFLEKNIPSKMEAFLMQNKAAFGQEWDAFVTDFNCKVIIEGLEWDVNVLFARLTLLASNWNRNKGSFKSSGNKPKYQQPDAPQGGRIELRRRG